MNRISAVLLLLSIPTSYAAAPQGPVTEICTFGAGEAKVTITIHKEFKKGAKKTVDLTRGTTFKKTAMPIVPSPGAPPPGKSYASYNVAGDKCVLNMSYGEQMQGSMNYDDEGVVFQTNELKCKSP